jgi:hypothetical protein
VVLGEKGAGAHSCHRKRMPTDVAAGQFACTLHRCKRRYPLPHQLEETVDLVLIGDGGARGGAKQRLDGSALDIQARKDSCAIFTLLDCMQGLQESMQGYVSGIQLSPFLQAVPTAPSCAAHPRGSAPAAVGCRRRCCRPECRSLASPLAFAK